MDTMKVILLFLALTVLGCKFPAKPPMPTPCSSIPVIDSVTNVVSQTSLLKQLNGFSLQNKVPTYQDDILPLLSSNTTGRNYACATCHSYMRTSSLVIPKIGMILVAIKPGASNPMPKIGYDRVSSQDIAILESWRAAKFPLTSADVVKNKGSSELVDDNKQSDNLGVNETNQASQNQRFNETGEATRDPGCS